MKGGLLSSTSSSQTQLQQQNHLNLGNKTSKKYTGNQMKLNYHPCSKSPNQDFVGQKNDIKPSQDLQVKIYQFNRFKLF